MLDRNFNRKLVYYLMHRLDIQPEDKFHNYSGFVGDVFIEVTMGISIYVKASHEPNHRIMGEIRGIKYLAKKLGYD
jgi:hypothetical protein